MVNVPTGGRKKKFNVSIATSEIAMATRSRAFVAVPSTTRNNVNATVVVLTSGSRPKTGGHDRDGERD